MRKVKQVRRNEEREREKDGPGPVMVSDTLCPAVHIVHSRAKGTADPYWIWAVFFQY